MIIIPILYIVSGIFVFLCVVLQSYPNLLCLLNTQKVKNINQSLNYNVENTSLKRLIIVILPIIVNCIKGMDQQDKSDHNSLSQNLNDIEQEPNIIIEEEVQQLDYNQKIDQIHQRVSKLNEEQQILKEALRLKQKQLLDTFAKLDQRKKMMRDLVLTQINRDQIQLDIALTEEFQELRCLIQNQKRQIQQLKDQISKQGLGGRNNDQQFIKMIFKIQEMQKQIQVGKKFASTQYVRDYLQKPQVYKVAYEEVKYQFEIRARIKDTLQQEKQLYLRKKQQIAKAITKEKQIEQQLLQEKDNLLRQLKALS